MPSPFDVSTVTVDDVEELLEERDRHGDGEEFRQALTDLDTERREQFEAMLDAMLDGRFPDGTTVPDRTVDEDFDADWDPDFEGWSGRSDPSVSDKDGSFLRRLTWRYRFERETFELEVPGPLFEYYTERSRTTDYGRYLSDPFDEPLVGALVDKLDTFVSDRGLNERERVGATVQFVQSLEYTPDKVTTGQVEYPKYPTETIVHDGGDCEDTSILLGALLSEFDCEVALLVLPNHSHMMLGVNPPFDVNGSYFEYEGTEYYPTEATGHGWDIGQMPPQYRNASAQIYPSESVPILVHKWEAKPSADGSIQVDGHLANMGDAKAADVTLALQFESDSDRVLARETPVSSETLYPSNSMTFQRTVSLPDDRRIRGKCLITTGHTLHDTSTSDWQ